MDDFQFVNRLQLNHHSAVDDEIEPMAAQRPVSIQNWYEDFALERDFIQVELDAHRLVVEGFQVSRSERLVNLQCASNDPSYQFLRPLVQSG